MYIREIHIENIRGFERVDLDLDRGDGKYAGWTVIAGRNGSGKSTLLKALALAAAGPNVARSLQKSFAGWIREGAGSASIKTQLVSDVGDWIGGDFKETVNFWTGLAWSIDTTGEEPSMAEPRDLEVLVPALAEPWMTERQKYRGPWEDNPNGWFLAAYGPFRRLGHREDYEEAGPQMAARLGSLFNEDVTLAESIQWFKDIYAQRLDLQEKVRKSRERDPSGIELLQNIMRGEQALVLQRLEEKVISLLNDGLLPNGAEVIDFDMRGLWIQQSDVTLPLRQFSDGYRAAIALVFDILRQMHRCFGELDVDVEAKPVVVRHKGVVLIDEIDAHLHVSWQRRIGFWLKQHFPNIQFIVTTHSPFVCQAADERGLIRLPTPGSGEVAEHVSPELFKTVVNGDVDDAVMTELFGLDRTHSDASEKLRRDVAALEVRALRGQATDEEKAELARLSDQLPKTTSAVVEQALRKLKAGS